MYELVISLKNGKRYSVGVRDYHEANAELARFMSQSNDEILDASVLDGFGNRVSRYDHGQLELFN
ncbi:hypothetical protein J6W91_01660 [Candidatus Saccharibacteria bacterium]|nr:hypothetical protein [Candidatus Saccharibacteria bacterium]